jgi:hypothetical protein
VTTWNAERCARLLAKPKQTPSGWRACCPSHEDNNPSLFLADGTDGLALVCYAGCTYEAIAAALEARGAVLKHPCDRAQIPSEHFQLGPYSSHWDYRDASGRVVMRVCRWEQPGARKDIRPLTRTEDGWKWAHYPAPRPLFQLDRLTNESECPVLLVEGEKTAIAAQRLFPDHIATTWSGGAAAVGQADLSVLKGRDVTLVPDCDAAGQKAMVWWAQRLRSQARSVRTVDPRRFVRDLPDGWDFADALAEGRDVSKWLLMKEEAAADGDPSIELLSFTPEQILAPVEPELELLPGIPADTYTLIPGALSSYKTTLLIYLLVWKATGWDILGLDERGHGVEIGNAVLVSYEDTDARIFKKLQRVIQHGRQVIAERWTRKDADEFVVRAAANLRRIPCSGRLDRRLVYRIDGMFVRNDAFIEPLIEAICKAAPHGALIGLDPLRLSVSVPQKDDEGAEVVVHTLNYTASAIPNSALAAASHTTKAGANHAGEGYAEGAYATSGSAVYSQHARSNFHMVRLEAKEARKLFAIEDVTNEEARKQRVVRLSHPRLSHGEELNEVYLLMRAGTLQRVRPAADKTPAEQVKAAAAPVFAALERFAADNVRTSLTGLETDVALAKELGGRNAVRDAVALLASNGHVQMNGKGRSSHYTITDSGRALLGASPRDSENQAGKRPPSPPK